MGDLIRGQQLGRRAHNRPEGSVQRLGGTTPPPLEGPSVQTNLELTQGLLQSRVEDLEITFPRVLALRESGENPVEGFSHFENPTEHGPGTARVFPEQMSELLEILYRDTARLVAEPQEVAVVMQVLSRGPWAITRVLAKSRQRAPPLNSNSTGFASWLIPIIITYKIPLTGYQSSLTI